jgi:hypothetical protein
MLNGSRVPQDLRRILWAECASTATLNENVFVSAGTQTKPPFTKLFKSDHPRARDLRRFGKIAVAKSLTKIKSKLTNKGIPVMFLGYLDVHSTDTYRMLNLSTKRVIQSRNLRWIYPDYAAWIRKGTEMDENDEIDIPENSEYDNEGIEPDWIESGRDNEGIEDDDSRLLVPTTETQIAPSYLKQMTRSAARVAKDTEKVSMPKPKQSSENARLIRAMSKLGGSGTFENLTATRVLESTATQDEGIERAFQESGGNSDDEINALALSVFGNDFAIFTKGAILDEHEMHYATVRPRRLVVVVIEVLIVIIVSLD